VTLTRAGYFILALLGTVLPFITAQRIIARLYPDGVTGVPVPLWMSLTTYGTAFVVAALILYVCFKAITKDREPSDKLDGLEERENLPY
jgi:hypothetical protein